MKSSALQILGWFILILSTSFYTQSQTKPVKKEPVSSISGKVTINGKGAGGMIVGLRAADPSNRQRSVSKGTTDQDGNYRITNVVPGTYQVVPAAFAFVVSGNPGGKTLIIAAGETVEGIDFALNRGGVITGKVTASDGRPLIEEQVTLLPIEGNNPGAQPYMFAQLTNQTDDRGVYRIFGIPQGRYRVAVGQSQDGSAFRRPRGSSYKQTFHPAGTDASKAAVIEVSEGSEATNIDITVGATVTTFTASGRIVDAETGHPLPNVKYGVQTLGQHRSSMVSANYISDRQGEFKLENLTPGKYAIFAVPQPNVEMRFESAPFDLIDQDVTGLLIKASPGASVSGVIALEGTNDRSVLTRLNQLRLHAYVANEGEVESWMQPLTISNGESFRIGGLQSGVMHFSLNATDGGQPRGFTITRVERDGVVQPSGLEIKEGAQVTGVRLVVGYGNGTIRGQIKVTGGELPANARFGVWLSNLGSDPTANQRLSLPSPNVDSRGHFVVEGLPAGNYEVNVAVHLSDSRGILPRGKQQVSVADGVVTEVTITIGLNPNPGPTFP